MSPIKEPNYFASEIRLERISERLRSQAEQDVRALRAYLDGPMWEKRFGGVVFFEKQKGTKRDFQT